MVKKTSIWLRFYISMGVLLLACLGWFFWEQSNHTFETIEQSLLERGRSHYKSILFIRRWAANHGGVYVLKQPGVESNPFLPNSDIETKDQRILLLRNPALITREISDYAEKDADFSFRVPGINPLNPNSQPDEWERKAIEQFQAGSKEITSREYKNNHTYFRYMTPVYAENSCLACHEAQGYKTGDIVGGISMRFNISELESKMNNTLRENIVIFLILSTLILLTFFAVIRFFQTKILQAERQIIELANLDGLTGLCCRRTLVNKIEHEVKRCKRYRHELGLIMIDLDHFKKINDKFGHQTGDDVLVKVAAVLRENTRSTDCAARYGGEELAIVLPEANIASTTKLAEKLCELIRLVSIKKGQEELNVTASFGVSSVTHEALENSAVDIIETLVKTADEALYRAKEGGRNQVCVTPS
ncbi:diguanylate cyclase [Pseudomonadota bacterium]